MSEMVERVAKALAQELDDLDVRGLYMAARDAIAAMREPTDEMVDAGREAGVADLIKDGFWERGQHEDVDLSRRQFRIMWRGMIDGALAEKETK